MKLFRSMLVLAIAAAPFIACSKSGGDEDPACMNDNTTTVEFQNTTNQPKRVVISRTQTANYVPIDPILTITIAPNSTETRSFEAGRWISTWYEASCSSNCERIFQVFRDWMSCEEYELSIIS